MSSWSAANAASWHTALTWNYNKSSIKHTLQLKKLPLHQSSHQSFQPNCPPQLPCQMESFSSEWWRFLFWYPHRGEERKLSCRVDPASKVPAKLYPEVRKYFQDESMLFTLSILSGLFVAATTVTLASASTPSSSVKSCASTLSWTLPPLSLPESPRFPHKASNSSKKTMEGATCLALLKRVRTAFSDSPTHLLNSSGPWFDRIVNNNLKDKCDNYLDWEEVETTLGCKSFGNHGLWATRRAIHQNSSGSFNSKSNECLGVF